MVAVMAKTHFGFETVDTSEKTGRVREVFDSVASRYDVMNDVMSAGMHRLWKDRFVRGLHLRPDMRILDLAGGTGDIATRMQKRAADSEITLCDINAEMLKEGWNRADKRGETYHGWVCGNGESLPFPSSHFDRVTIAFGIRNVTDIPACLSECFRVLKPGGMFACLEFSQLPNAKMQQLYDMYSFAFIPRMGQLIAGDRDSYQYLVESIRRFPDQERFAAMLREAGMERVNYTNMTHGVVAMHHGWKI
jgi:ubiquinone/menaquinone biosynthesis methyltransferase